jgi:hypothetical protein
MLAALGAVLLVVSPALPWFTLQSDNPYVGPAGGAINAVSELALGKSAFVVRTTAFGASTPLGVLLLVCGLVALVTAAFAVAGRPLPGRVPCHHVMTGCGLIAIAATLYLVVEPPNLLPGGSVVNDAATLVGIRPIPQLGAYLALIAALGVIAGAALIDGGPLAPPDLAGGRLRAAIGKAWQLNAHLAVQSLAIGAAAIVVALLGVVDQSPLVVGIGLALSIATVAMARVARQHAQATDNPELVYLTRFGQTVGWLIITTTAVLLVIAIIAIGQTATTINHVSSGL